MSLPDASIMAPVVTTGVPTRFGSRPDSKWQPDVTQVAFTTDKPFDEYEVRIVPSEESTRMEGVVIQKGRHITPSTCTFSVVITDEELGTVDTRIVKIFARNAAGWSV
jgi:hypothetical protein